MKHCYLALFALLIGCSEAGTGANLHGAVTLDGKPLESGTVLFVPQGDKGQPVQATIEHGKYVVKNVPVGKVKALITSMKKVGEVTDAQGRTSPKLESVVPAKYSQGIELNLVAGSQEQSIILTADP